MALGKAVPVLDAPLRVTGRLAYASDLRLPDMLTARVLRSLVSHARLTRLDATAAQKLPGVVAVLTAADLGQPGGPGLLYGAATSDQPVVAGDRIRYVGEPLALVAAESDEVARAALALIEVEWEELPGVYEALAAVQPGAPVLHDDHLNNVFRHVKLRHGDLDAGFASADEIVEETYSSPAAQQASLEPHVAAAQWLDGQLTVWSATQAPYQVRGVLAELFGIDAENVRLIVPHMGGGFGGKGHVKIEPMIAALAWKTGGRPVRLALTRAEEFVTVTKHAATVTIKTGVKRDGRITARQVTVHWNGGAYADASPSLVRSGLVRAGGPYRIPAAWIDSYGCYTNLPPAAAFRGAMSSQTAWAYESHMDTIAHRLGIDPLELRLKNLLHTGDTFITGETMHSLYFKDCLESVANGLGWDARKTPDSGSGRYRRGRGLAVMIKSTRATSRSECRLVLDSGGGLTLYHSIVEMGQGADTALAQIAASAVGVPFEAVRVPPTDTRFTPFDSGTSSSRGTSMMGAAIRDGAARLKQQLIEAAAPLLEQPVEKLAAADGYVVDLEDPARRISYADILINNQMRELVVTGHHSIKGGIDPETGQGVAGPDWHQGAGACEIEVDTETGRIRVLRYHAASFAGTVVNPQLARLQNDGNVIYGLGPALLEEIAFDGGQVTNANLSDYMLPSMLDIPPELVSYAVECDTDEIHGIGEMSLPPVAPAIANALFDATGVRVYDLPLTAERVLRALRNE